MRLLIVTATFPNPPTDGLRIPVYHLVRLLAPRHQVHLVAFHPPQSPPSAEELGLVEGWGVKVTLLPTRRLGLWAQFVSNVSSLPHSLYLYRTPEAFATLRRLASEADLVHAMSFNMGQFREACAGKPGVFSPYDAVSQLIERQLRQPRLGMTYQMYYRSQLPKVVDFEREVMPRWDAVHFVTEVDAEAVRKHAATARIEVVPNGVDVDWYAPPEPRPTTVEPEVVFTGAMFGSNNVDAATFFHRDVLPFVRAKRPEVQFVVAGRDPSPALRALGHADRRTTVTGTVPDLRGYLWRAAVYVCPLRIGVGIKNRLLEAMAAGCPIVSTSVGVEGMDVADGEHVLAADSPEAIAAAVLRLLADRQLARRLGDAARERAVSRYSWETMARRTEALYTEALERHARRQKV